MMDRSRAHLIANLGLAGLLWASTLVGIWAFLDVGLIERIVLSFASLVVAGAVGHRLIPRLTGPVIEKVYARRHGPPGMRM